MAPHRLRRGALHLPAQSQGRGPFQYLDRLLWFVSVAKREIHARGYLLPPLQSWNRRFATENS